MRLFLAIEPDDVVRRRVGELIERLRGQTSGVRWTAAEKLHLTLAFFGKVESAQVPRLTHELSHCVDRHPAFRASVAGAGVFPSWRKPRVVWLGIEHDGALTRLVHDISGISESNGFPRDRPFTAHLTIGRIGQPLPAEVFAVLRRALEPWADSYPFDVSRVVLMQSALKPTGSVYTPLATFPLRGK